MATRNANENSDKVIVLTGAGGGLGRNISSYLIQRGFRNLALVYRNRKDELVKILRELDLDPDKHTFQAELSDESHVASLRSDVESRLGEVFGLVNLAGGSTNGMSWKLSASDFKKVIDDNLLSTFNCCKEFIPGFRERGAGRIINVSSVVANIGIAGASHYAAAKAGILGFTRSLALELANKSITVNALSLGYFEHGLIELVSEELQTAIKDKIPLKRFGKAEEVAGMIEYLLRPEGAYTTGQTLHINGGLYL